MEHALEVSVDLFICELVWIFSVISHSVRLLTFEIKYSNLVNTRKWLVEQVVVVLTRSEVSA